MLLRNKIATFIFNLISKTWRIKIKGEFPQKPSIVVFWHGSMLPVWKLFERKNAIGVVSKSKDGQLLSDLLIKWKFSLIRGSSSVGGKEVLLQIVKSAVSNYLLMTPDGPRGPIFEFKPGAVVGALRANVPIVYAKAKIESKKQFIRAWDKFQFPLPFSKCEVEFSEPIIIPVDSTRDAVNSIITDIQNKMNA